MSKLNVWYPVISFHGQIVPTNSQIVPQNSQFVPQNSQFVPHMKSQVLRKNNVSFIPQADKVLIDPKSIRSILSRLKTNKKRFQPATGFNILTAALRAFKLESVDGFERYSTTNKSYAVL